MGLCDITVYFKVLKSKLKQGLKIDPYTLVCNTYVYRVLEKLNSLQLIKDLQKRKSGPVKLCNFNPGALRKIKFYHRPTLHLNMKNYRDLIKQQLQNNPYNTLLISTSKGIMTLKQAVKSQTGGYVIAKYTAKRQVFYQ